MPGLALICWRTGLLEFVTEDCPRDGAITLFTFSGPRPALVACRAISARVRHGYNIQPGSKRSHHWIVAGVRDSACDDDALDALRLFASRAAEAIGRRIPSRHFNTECAA
ncbi:hypothetical protein [Sphingomonas paucimobilis]|uniref:hypothetical protein n=1 Tax=Sphingomonas paucimobilis TaxID=13689 RepID=UPI000AF19976|nr:hypothetical protein [Sphingomonas paucimobilis]